MAGAECTPHVQQAIAFLRGQRLDSMGIANR